MNATWTVARKELRSIFESPIALIFLGVFQIATLFTFFAVSRFFARNIADVRPLFEWLPLLLILLVSAITMRQWAEERKMGTLEVLLTLPVRTRDLVLGKFMAGVLLVALALALTTPLPLMVSFLGDLDLGPVIGGYVGALLLGSLYVAIGLCISARTDNQVVALMVTLVVGGALYIVGSPAVVDLFGNQLSEVLRGIGTGSRFESIERGVLDLRDLAYYGGLTAFFLSVNGLFLELDRVDSGSRRGRAKATGLALTVALVGANALAAVLWLTPVTSARIDLTENGEYSISPTTTNILADLEEPLFIDGYFSERTHPLLSPMVPQIRDLLAEYEIAGGAKVEVDFADPNEDEELEQELAEQYSIRSVPFQVDDRHQQSVVNSFFHVLVRYGDQYEVLSFDDLIEVQADSDGIDVRLRNLEYDLTRTIKRVSQDFQTISSVLAALPEPATLTLYTTPATLPEAFSDNAELVRTVTGQIADASAGKLTFVEVDPSGDAALQERLYATYGLRPLATDLFARETFYLDVVIEMGDAVERLVPRGELSESDMRQAIESSLQRVTPGQLTTLGVFTEIPIPPPPNPQIPPQFQPPPPQPDYQGLQQMLGETYEVTTVELDEGEIPATIDVLLVGKTGPLSDTQSYAIDQYLMRGGAVIALAGQYGVEAGRQGLATKKLDPSLNKLLSAWGVSVDDGIVLDSQNAAFPIPVQERRGGMVFQRIELLPYPFFPDIRSDAFDRDHPSLAGIPNLTAPWASPLSLEPPEGVEASVLASTSASSWIQTTPDIDPDFTQHPGTGFPAGTALGAQVVAVALTGSFPSYFSERPNPTLGGDVGDGDPTVGTTKSSMADARLVVLGSAEMVSDLALQLGSQPTGEVHRANLQFLQNLIDWSVEDTELLDIRTSGAFARTLVPLTEGERSMWEWTQYLIALLLLAAVTFLPRGQRRIPTLQLDTVEQA